MTTAFEVFRTPIQLRKNVNGSYVNGLWQDGSIVQLSEQFVTGNSVSISINTVVLASIPYTVSSQNTLLLIQAALLLQPNIVSVFLSGMNNLTITIIPLVPYLSIVDFFTVTGGSTQPIATITNSPSISTITASIQPVTGEELLLIPEARREKEVYKMFTSYLVNTLTSENPDQVMFFGKVFEVYEVKPWQNNSNFIPINNYCYYVMRLQPLAP